MDYINLGKSGKTSYVANWELADWVRPEEE